MDGIYESAILCSSSILAAVMKQSAKWVVSDLMEVQQKYSEHQT